MSESTKVASATHDPDHPWRQESLVFTLQDGTDEYTFDVIPYLGDGPNASKELMFPHPKNLKQSDIISLMKEQALQQGVRLVTAGSSANPDSEKGCHFRLVCEQNRLPIPMVTEENKKRQRETTRPTKREDRCPFSLGFRLDENNNFWVLSSGWGSAEHKHHPKTTLPLVPRQKLGHTTLNTNGLSTPITTPKPRPRVVLGITGSVAAIKGPELAVRLSLELEVDVRVLLTRGGHNFWGKAQEYNPSYWNQLQELTRAGDLASIRIHYADDEWKGWNRLGDSVLHIELREWADMLVMAPLSAHTLAKLAQGFCDDTLTCVARAWDLGHGVRPGKPMLLAPAMNTAMWEHPLTQQQLSTIQGFWSSSKTTSLGKNGIQVVPPQAKTLACGELGNGALASVDTIVKAVKKNLK